MCILYVYVYIYVHVHICIYPQTLSILRPPRSLDLGGESAGFDTGRSLLDETLGRKQGFGGFRA